MTSSIAPAHLSIAWSVKHAITYGETLIGNFVLMHQMPKGEKGSSKLTISCIGKKREQQQTVSFDSTVRRKLQHRTNAQPIANGVLDAVTQIEAAIEKLSMKVLAKAGRPKTYSTTATNV